MRQDILFQKIGLTKKLVKPIQFFCGKLYIPMNYHSFANYTDAPPDFGKSNEAYYDRGSGVPSLTKNNMTIQDIYRTPFLFLQEHKNNYGNMSSLALKGIQTNNELSNMFFSDDNFKRIQ